METGGGCAPNRLLDNLANVQVATKWRSVDQLTDEEIDPTDIRRI